MGPRASLMVLLAACAPAHREPAPPPPVVRSEPDASVAVDAMVAEPETPDAGSPPPPPVEERARFAPEDVGPTAPSTMARADDGKWAPLVLANEGDEGAVLYRTVLHPDPTRAAADLYVVAMDLGRVGLRAVAGVSEPAGRGAPRPAVVPPADRPTLLAAFNGGWKSEHGHYGMKADGVVLVPASAGNCTVAGYDDEAIRVGPWNALASDEPQMRFYRQTPPCLFTGGVRHPGLAVEMTRNWGATETGDPLIRRSAIGVSKDQAILFFGLGNLLTARALADGIHHAGAADVAELDVNWSYPKFLVYQPNSAGALEASSPFPNFVFDKSEYVRRRSDRDFFYVFRRR